jgi:hypothetical protein
MVPVWKWNIFSIGISVGLQWSHEPHMDHSVCHAPHRDHIILARGVPTCQILEGFSAAGLVQRFPLSHVLFITWKNPLSQVLLTVLLFSAHDTPRSGPNWASYAPNMTTARTIRRIQISCRPQSSSYELSWRLCCLVLHLLHQCVLSVASVRFELDISPEWGVHACRWMRVLLY